jgi:probable F420-dependent oxidoreductase
VPELAVTLPYWLDRPPGESLELVANVEACGIGELWLGEMATFEAFSLAGAIAATTSIPRLVVGPLPVTLRDAVMLAMGLGTLREVAGRPVHLALGASTPTVRVAWHGVSAAPTLQRFRDTVTTVRALLDGGRSPGGFRLRLDGAGATIAIAAFGPRLLALAGELADTVVLNLVTVDQLARAREAVASAAIAAGRRMPRVAVWVPAALDRAGVDQLARGLALYLPQPGYGEMFSAIGFRELVDEARRGSHPKDLDVPDALVGAIGALGSPAEIAARVDAFGAAGADVVCLAPATAGDPGAARLLRALSVSR